VVLKVGAEQLQMEGMQKESCAFRVSRRDYRRSEMGQLAVGL